MKRVKEKTLYKQNIDCYGRSEGGSYERTWEIEKLLNRGHCATKYGDMR